MGKGKRAETGMPIHEKARRAVGAVWRFVQKHKVIFIPAGAGVFVLLLTLALVLALGGQEPPPEPEETPPPPTVLPSPSPSPSPPPSPEPSPEPEPELYGANPLTGLPLEDEASAGNRPVAIMHNNSYNPGGRQHALPMYGVGQADVIYEVMAEGNITRMLAFYHDLSAIPKIGAVRSTRTYYVELALAYDAILVHAGGSPQAVNRDIPNWGVSNIDSMRQSETYFWRDRADRPNVSSEHTLFTSGERLMELVGRISRLTVPEDFDNGLCFAAETALSGGAAASVKAPHSRTKPTWFTYNEDDGLYYVEQYGGAFVDGGTGEQVSVTNVLIIQTSIGLIPGDSAGRLAVDLQSGGAGYYAAGGSYLPIRWARESHDAPFVYTLEDGSPLEMRPGKTFVCVIPKDQTPEFE